MNKKGLIAHIELWVKKLGSASKVAEKVGVSKATISQILSGTYGADDKTMFGKIAVALDYRENDWQIVRNIANYQQIAGVVNDAKEESMWLSISNPAGSGKTGTLRDIFEQDETGSVFYVQCEEWTGQQFLKEMVRKIVGAEYLKGSYKSNTELIKILSQFFNERQFYKPVLLIDEADKLRPTAFRSLIPLFNQTEDRLGLILCGTENLSKEVERGVRLKKKGYDEIHSRIGRRFLDLDGADIRDIFAICHANGITDDEGKQAVYYELEKKKEDGTSYLIQKYVDEKEKYVLEDFRRLKRIIKRIRLINGK